MTTADLAKLQDKFPAEDIEWRIGQSGSKGGKPWAKVLAYIDNRAIQNRLDEVCGPENWKNEFKEGPGGGVLCGISIRCETEWVTKWDGAENTKIESIKGGLSDAMKRAGYQWGIGRYLYDIGDSWAVFTDAGTYSAKIDDAWQRWNPPQLSAKFLPANSTKAKGQVPGVDQHTGEITSVSAPLKAKPKTREESDKCSTGDIVRMTNLIRDTGTDSIKLYEHYGLKPNDVPTKAQAKTMIEALQNKLSKQLDANSDSSQAA